MIYSNNKIFKKISTYIFLTLSILSVNVYSETNIKKVPLPKASKASENIIKIFLDINKVHNIAEKDCINQVAKYNKKIKSNELMEAEYFVNYDVLMDTPSIYSIVSDTEWDCMGVHPSGYQEVMVFDMIEGNRYNPLNLYFITKNKSEDSKSLLPSVRKMIKNEMLAYVKDNDECKDEILNADFEEIYESSQLYFALSKNGLMVIVNVPRQVQNCYTNITIPYIKLNKYLVKSEALRLGWNN